MNERFTIAPWQAKGRWYHFFIESDGTDYTLTTSDVTDAEISSGYLKLPKHFRIVDDKIVLNSDASAATEYTRKRKVYADGSQAVALPGVAIFDFADLWIFAYPV